MKPPVAALAIAFVISAAAILLWRRHFSVPSVAPGPESRLLGKWTLDPLPTGQTQKPGAATQTVLGFAKGGAERVIAWLAAPHHPRPRPVTIQATYSIIGDRLVQTVAPHSPAFSGMRLVVTDTSKGVVLTSRYSVHGDALTLSQPDNGRSVILRHTTSSLPPGGPPSAR